MNTSDRSRVAGRCAGSPPPGRRPGGGRAAAARSARVPQLLAAAALALLAPMAQATQATQAAHDAHDADDAQAAQTATPGQAARLVQLAQAAPMAPVGPAAPPAAAPPPATVGDGWLKLPARPRVSYETVQSDAGEKMGLVGTTYLIEALPRLCVGPAVYGSASGQRGGMFTVGGEVALCTPLVSRLSLVAGVYAGGGGGGGAPVGGGLMLRPHADLLWDFGPLSAGLSWSYLSFPGGDYGSSQLGLVLQTETGFRRWAGGPAQPSTAAGGVGFDRVIAQAGLWWPRAGTLAISGAPLGTIALVGARAEADLVGPLWLGVETNAAANNAAGYAEFLGNLGATWAIDDVGRLRAGGRIALGMGGGGDLPVGGGLLVKAAVDASWQLTPGLGLGLEAGWAAAPQGDLAAPYGLVALRWQLQPLPGQPVRLVRQDWSVGVETVFDAARKIGPARSLQQVSLKYARYLNDWVYLNGQVQSAFSGEAGAFSVGLFGVGATWAATPALALGAELALGAAGGGGVDTGRGAVVKPLLQAGLVLSPHAALRVGGGWLKALDGPLSSAVAELTLVYRFDTLGAY